MGDDQTSDQAPIEPGGDDPGGGQRAWTTDGSLVREEGTADVYVIFGGAKFKIPTIDEFRALGYEDRRVHTLPARTLAQVGMTPSIGTALRERTDPETYVMASNCAVHVPTEDALALLGIAAARVGVLPVGGLTQLTTYQLPSIAATPPSMVIAPNQIGATAGTRWARTEVPGVMLPNGVQVVELYGWLRSAEQLGNTVDPDWHFGVEPDPEWLERLGVDLTTFVKVGDILMMGADRVGDHTAVSATPILHVEVDGWRDSAQVGRTKPRDWTVGPDQTGVADATWPWVPLDPTGSGEPQNLLDRRLGEYVHVSGSLVTDQPHSRVSKKGLGEWWHGMFGGDVHSEELYATAARMWEGNSAREDPTNPARWTEMHPPDVLELVPQAAERNAWLTGVCVVCAAPTLSPSGVDNEITTTLRPPGARPPHKRLAVREFVGPETRFGSIVEGNTNRDGAQITVTRSYATVHVKVHGDAFDGPPGKFKAVYRLTWEDDPGPYEMRVQATPAAAPAGRPTTVTVDATDTDTGLPLQAEVLINGVAVGKVGTPFTYTFTFPTRRVWVTDVEPSGTDQTGRAALQAGGGGHWELEALPVPLTLRATGYVDGTTSIALHEHA
jgi:hypothetical protein